MDTLCEEGGLGEWRREVLGVEQQEVKKRSTWMHFTHEQYQSARNAIEIRSHQAHTGGSHKDTRDENSIPRGLG